ncbi:MAG: tetratricopeptide repeat protein [Planctomycetota bacterium]
MTTPGGRGNAPNLTRPIGTSPKALADRVAAGRKDYLASIRADAGRAITGAARPTRGDAAHIGSTPAITSGTYGGGYGGNHGHGAHSHYSSGHTYNGYCHNGWSYDYGHTFWGHWGHHCYGIGSLLWSPFYTCGYWWNSYWYCGGSWSQYHSPSWYWYGPFLPARVSVIVNTEPEVIYVESEPEVVYVDAPAGEGAVAPSNQPSVPQAQLVTPSNGALNRAADYYLSLGDRAFREGRFGDAVHHYAKAIEFSPEDGILHLVLADALFATGDYRYAAYALREALEKDPALAANVVDKRSFYADPAEFEAQLAVLERYLEDHFLDDDARLVLAANYLFGGRPLDAVKLLESPFSETLRTGNAGALILQAARDLTARSQGPSGPR